MAADSNLDRQLEEAAGAMLKALGRLLVSVCKGIFRGIRKLNRLPPWIGVAVSVLLSFLAYRYRAVLWAFLPDAPEYIKGLLYGALLGLPAVYLLILGGIEDQTDQDYEKLFGEIGFIGKDGKAPQFDGRKADGKKSVLSFRSNIPLADWKAARARLETAIDCTILKLEYGNSKKVVQMTVLPADFRLPEMAGWSDEYCSPKNGTVTVGAGALGNITFDLNRVPHVLVAGETGSGKSVILRCILWQMILQGCRVYMIDFKGGVEFGKQYERFGEVITQRERALEVLEMLVNENAYRLQIFRDLEVKNLAEYNKKTGQNLSRIGVFSDEIAEMLDKKGVPKEERAVFEALEGKLSTLARLSRATGINLFLGVQRPDANVLTGQIKNNIPVRISGRFADKAASEIVLGNTDAVDLPDIKGRFLYKVGNETLHFQAFYFDDETMLHDVSVDQGDMLLEAPRYTPEHYRVQPMQMTKKQERPPKDGAGKNRESCRRTTASKGRTAERKRNAGEQKKSGPEYSDQEIVLNMDFDYGKLSEEEPLPF